MSGPYNFSDEQFSAAFEGFKALSGCKYQRPDHYAGDTYHGTVVIAGHHRDSDLLTESNWSTWQKTFKDSPNVVICGASHWAVGWVEAMYMLPTATDEEKATAEEMLCALADYPILDEDDLTEREMDAAYEYWNGWTDSPDYRHRLQTIAWWNDKNKNLTWRKPVPFLAARHDLHKLSELYPEFEQWICEVARE